MTIKVNGKEVSTEEALATLKKEGSILTHVSFEAKNENKSDEVSNEGFSITAEYLGYLSEKMDRLNADLARVTLSKSGKIKNKDVYIIMVDPARKGVRTRLFKALMRLLD